MQPLGMHAGHYKAISCNPVHYLHTSKFEKELSAFASLCLPILKQRFPLECLVMQHALHLFDEISPFYLGGSSGISLAINISHNFASSSHYDSGDYSPSIVMWVMDDEDKDHLDQYLVFNNVLQMIDNNEIKRGLMIKISDGMLLSFQGQSLHHGTTIHHHSITGELCPSRVIFGIHFGLSMPNLNAMHQLQIDQYMREMCLTPQLIQNKHNSDCCPPLSLQKNLIQFQKQTSLHNNKVAKIISNLHINDEQFEILVEMEEIMHNEIVLECNKELLIVDDNKMKGTPEDKLKIVKYEKIKPNWMALVYMLLWNHEIIPINTKK